MFGLQNLYMINNNRLWIKIVKWVLVMKNKILILFVLATLLTSSYTTVAINIEKNNNKKEGVDKYDT